MFVGDITNYRISQITKTQIPCGFYINLERAYILLDMITCTCMYNQPQ